MIRFNATKEERAIIGKIADRAVQEFKDSGAGPDQPRLHFEMDLLATHSNGCPLDLQKLLDFDTFNFRHDIAGIYNCLDRNDESKTAGQLLNLFRPRCAKRD